MTGDRCSACGTPLAPDQRYCVECGDRRGPARFVLPTPASPAEPPSQSQRPRGRPWMSPSSTLIAGVATLLLAMGIGVLIGRSGTASAQRAPSAAPVHVTVSGGGGGSGAGSVTSASVAPAAKKTRKSSKSHRSSARTAAAVVTATTVTSQAPPPPTVTVGAKGSGAGYQNGHFTGNFFGP